ncbi:MAG TPA: VIT and VWA domain-containing protein, partial [Polyangiaceae bacterium]|nr:VIT and VWA domain-containing protein [Polyangiaceae bacterium]
MNRARFGTLALLILLALQGCSNGHVGSLGPHAAASAGSPLIDDEPDPADAGGIGWLTARNERGEGGLIELAQVNIDAEQIGDYAAVSIEHRFVSRATTVQEGTFRFPLPEDALLTGLSMLIDGRVVHGELLEREKARRIYEEIVDSMQDPALLEWEHGSTFKMRVFPIEPQQPKLVTIRYLVPLKHKGKQWVFSQGTRQNAGAGKLSELTLRWQGKQVVSERGVQAGRILEATASDPSDVLREERPEAAYTAVRVRPDWAQVPVQTRTAPKHWVFVVDTSRSALEERKLQLETLRTLLAALGPQERFTP